MWTRSRSGIFPGLVKVVVRKDFVGVVAETQYQAMLAARQLVVRWNPGPRLPPQKTFFEHLQKQPSQDTLSVDSGDVEQQLAAADSVLRARYTYPYQMHGSVGASCAVADVKAGWRHRMVRNPIGLSDAEYRGEAAEPAARQRACDLCAGIGMLWTERRRCCFVRCGDPVPGGGKAGPSAVLTPGRDDVGEPRRGLRHRASGGLGPDGRIAAWDREELGSFAGKPARL